MKTNNKTSICVTLDLILVEELRQRRVNISGLVNSLLENYLNLKEDCAEKDIKELKEKELKAESELIALKQQRRVLEDNERRKKDAVAEQIKKGELIILK